MVKQNINDKKGFTIIEVVLVLAIAGLIFLMVFIALPALQRSQRNTQRRDDYSMLSTAVTNYMSNNGGRLSKILGSSTTGPTYLDPARWINEEGSDPNGNPYEVVAYTFDTWNGLSTTSPSSEVTHEHNASTNALDTVDAKAGSQVFVITGANCNESDANGDAMPRADKGSNAFAIYGYMEGGTFYCQASGSIGDKTSTNAGE